MARRAQGAGSVYLRKDGRYAASAMYEGKRITKYGKTKKEAWDNLQAVLDDLKQGKIVIGPKQTVKQYLEHWLEDSRRLKVRARTLSKYRDILRLHLIPNFGHLQLNQLSRERIQAFYAGLYDDGAAPRSIQLIHVVFSSAMKEALGNKLIAENPCSRITLPRIGKADVHVLTTDECKRLVNAARGHRLWLFILMAVTIGARCGELLALQWDDIDINGRLVHIRRTVGKVNGLGTIVNAPKTVNSLRKIRLSQIVINGFSEQVEFIKRIRSKAGSKWEERNLVFPNRHGGYLDRLVVMGQFGKILDKAGLPHMRIHDMRHSAATLLLSSGVNAKVVQETLGHSDIKITLGMYGHVMPDMQQDAANKMDGIFSDLD